MVIRDCDISRISIHAPAKGATRTAGHSQRESIDFNPRSREGSDCIAGWRVVYAQDFNPRSREGSD